MVKKVHVKKSGVKKPVKKTRISGINSERILIENFVSLQKVMANLSSKFDHLAGQISKLLELFEISAKALAEKEAKIEKGESDKKVAEKLDKLLDQNKTIARGLTLLHEVQNEEPPPQPPMPAPPPMQPKKPYPQIREPLMEKRKTEDIGGYQKSISSKNMNYEE